MEIVAELNRAKELSPHLFNEAMQAMRLMLLDAQGFIGNGREAASGEKHENLSMGQTSIEVRKHKASSETSVDSDDSDEETGHWATDEVDSDEELDVRS